MEAAQDTISPSQDQDVAAAATPLRYVVIVGEHSYDGSAAYRIEDPARLLRVYSLLQATFEQLQDATQR